MNKNTGLLLLLAATTLVCGCARQSTPSMMNTNKPQVVGETRLEQMPIGNVSDGYLAGVAESYRRYGNDTLQISLVYDPASKSYTAMKAFNDLGGIKTKLKNFGVRNVEGEIVKQQGTEPTLMVSYDALIAKAPEGCRGMPGMKDGLTDAHIGDYRFGCSVDSLIAQQIYRPSDLQGNALSDPGDGRRASAAVEYYRRIEPTEVEGDLDRFDRNNIQQ